MTATTIPNGIAIADSLARLTQAGLLLLEARRRRRRTQWMSSPKQTDAFTFPARLARSIDSTRHKTCEHHQHVC